MGVERQIPIDLKELYDSTTDNDYNHGYRKVRELIERIADHAAEVEKRDALLRRCYEALTYANPMSLEPQDIERHKAVIRAVDQQLQPKGEQL